MLRRQLRRLMLEADAVPSPQQWAAFLQSVDRSYDQADKDRYTMERSLLISSAELRSLYDDLKASSETKLAEERDKLSETNQFLDSIFENIPNMVFVKDAETLRFVRFNRAGEELVGIQSEELIGKSDHDLFPPEHAELFARRDREVLRQEGVVVFEDEPLQTRAGTRRLRTKKIPIRGDNGEPKYLLGISEDITDARRREEEVQAARDTAEKASRAKSDFLANMSHELRTPLNAILGFSRVLDRSLSGKLASEQREFFVYISLAAEHMLRLVNDLLDLRSLDEVALRIARVPLAPIVQGAADMLRPLMDEKRIALTLDVPDAAHVLGERGALSQVFINLLSNAVKFTPEHGRIRIAAELDGDVVRVSVCDTGAGIDPRDQERLFVYFEQLGGKHAHNMKGSGIGLALTKALVAKQGGTIEVHSAIDQGSTFTVCLRVAA